MDSSTRGARRRRGSAASLRRLLSLLGGGVLVQAAAGGCEESLSSIAGAMGRSLATGLGNGLSKLSEAMVLNFFT